MKLNPAMPEAKALEAVLALVSSGETPDARGDASPPLQKVLEEHPMLAFWYGDLLVKKGLAL